MLALACSAAGGLHALVSVAKSAGRLDPAGAVLLKRLPAQEVSASSAKML